MFRRLWKFYSLILLIVINSCGFSSAQFSTDLFYKEPANDNLGDVVQFLREYDREASDTCNRIATAEWKYATNATDFNRRRMKEQQNLASKFECISWRRASRYDTSRILENNLRRQLDRIVYQGKCGLGDEKHLEITHVITMMKDNYNQVRVCPYRAGQTNLYSDGHNVTSYHAYCDLRLEPDLTSIMERSRNERELKYAWTEFREKVGPPNRNTFMRYIDLANQAAVQHGFRDAGEQMREVYEDPDFFFTVQDLWTQVQPLYKQLFSFVRKGLYIKYGDNVLRRDGPIPAHILGNMWGQNWRNIIDIIKPHLETPDITGEMIKQGYTPTKIFQVAEEFFTSLGLPPMSPEFWRNSIIQKPNDVYTQCAASAWDFCNLLDFRIKQCTQISLEDFINSHHEMTHIHYYMQYTTQPFIYRDSPNPAFHEAVAHAIALNVGGPVHLQKIGLLSSPISASNGNSMINIEYLLNVALDKLPFMAFSLTVEKWRWYVFEKGPVGMNSRWWDLRLRFQGIIPPDVRTSQHFDAGAKYHVISDQDYIKYFVATILQFQIYAELCSAANHIGPLHTCDFYRSREAGRLLSDFMQRGASLSSSQLIKLITRGKTSRLSVDPLLEFFRPLEAWLESQNRDESIIGWSSNMDDVQLFQYIGFNHATDNLNLRLNKLLTIICSMLILKLM
ncbi:hypothetical protein ACKWTF_007011 [Chironomus riparius]